MAGKEKASKKTQKSVFTSKKHSFPIIGIGASAGGLEAFELFFKQIPAKTGMAYIVVTHLDPDHESLMSDLIKNYTPMPVYIIKNGLEVMPNTIYVIPPGKNVSIKKQVLHLHQQNEPHYSNLPINFFLSSLALDQAENAVAVILSGSGSDGSFGVRDIKLHGGIVIAQDPVSAKFDGMPKSVIQSGYTDYILPPNQIPDQLIKWSNYGDLKEGKVSAELMQIFTFIRAKTGYDFSSYKLSTICRRIEKQMHLHHLKTIADYVLLLRQDSEEINKLFKDLLIGVTRFFRDPEAFAILKKDIIPKILKNKPLDYCLRIWVPGCSTGEEVYSIAMTIAEYMEKTKHHYYVQIFGTDIDSDALASARTGTYSEDIIHDVSEERLKRFFIKDKNQYKIKKDIRSMVVFGEQNIVQDPPFTKVDMISCRNLLIYLNSKLQKKILPIFHYSLKPSGVLFLGMSESIAGFTDLFQLENRKAKFFERKNTMDTRHERLLTSRLAHHGEISLHAIHPKNLTDETLESHLALQKLLLKKFSLPMQDDTQESTQNLKVSSTKKNKIISDLENELRYTRENLQATIEELESSNEELQSVNEELQSTNEEIETSKEELQSLNEELVVMNTELQNRIDQLATVHDDMTNLFNSTEIATLFLDNKLCIKRFTPKAQEFISLIPADIGRSIHHFAIKLKYEKLTEDAEEVLRTLNQKSIEVQSKSERWLSIRILPYRTVANMIDGVIITLTDITEHKEAERKYNQLNKALQNALTCSKNILDTVSTPLLVLGIDLSILSANRSFYKAFHLLPEDVIGKLIYQLRDLNFSGLRDTLEKDFPKDNAFEGFEIEKVSNKKGFEKISINARKIYNDELGSDVILVALGAQIMDPTKFADLRRRAEAMLSSRERKKIPGQDVYQLVEELSLYQIELEIQNEDLIKTQIDLQASHNQYADLYHLAPIAYFTLNSMGLVIDVNQAGLDLLGMKKQRIVNRSFSLYIIPESQTLFSQYRKRLLEENTSLTTELKLVRWSGPAFDAQLVSKVVGEGGDPLNKHILTCVTDISSLKSLEQSMHTKRVKMAAIDRVRSMNEQIYSFAYDQNRALSVIDNYIYGCIRRVKDQNFKAEDLLHALRKVEQQSREMFNTILQIKNSASKDVLRYELINMNTIIQETLPFIHYEIPEFPVTIQYDQVESFPSVMLDKLHIQHVILSLARNAIESMRDAKTADPKLLIELCLTQQKTIEMTMLDNGPGFEEKVMPQLFEPHFTTKSYAMGLGLSVSRSIVEKLGGQLLAQMNPSGGSCFQVSLPCAEHHTINFKSI